MSSKPFEDEDEDEEGGTVDKDEEETLSCVATVDVKDCVKINFDVSSTSSLSFGFLAASDSSATELPCSSSLSVFRFTDGLIENEKLGLEISAIFLRFKQVAVF